MDYNLEPILTFNSPFAIVLKYDDVYTSCLYYK